MDAHALVPAGTDTLDESPLAKALAGGDELLAAGDLMGALERYLRTLTAEDPEDAPFQRGPDVVDQLRVQVRIATVLFSVGAHEQGRHCLARAAALADRAAWTPGVEPLPPERDPVIAAEWARWERITRSEGLDRDELARLADLLRRWGGVYARRKDAENVRRALVFWSLGGHLHERRCPSDEVVG